MRATTAVGLALAALLATWAAAGFPPGGPGRAPDGGVPAHEAAAAAYQCSMHPQVVAASPGQCPICGMALSRVEPAADAADERRQEAARGDGDDASEASSASAAPPSHASFTLSAARQQLIGVETAAVAYRELHRELRVAGQVAFDPELYAALAEHRDLQAAREGLQTSATEEERRRVDALWRASTVRLSLLGISSSELAAVARAGDATSLLLPGRSAWVYATIYGAGTLGGYGEGLAATAARRLAEPRVGQGVRVTTRALPGRVLRGRLVTVEPLSGGTAVGRAATRDVRVRALVETRGGGLERGTFVDLVVEIPLGRRLAVPEDAVLDTGTRQLAFVRHADGRFEPREVVLGVEGEGEREVLAGLSAGEQVVSSATFLIDSESRFRAAQLAFSQPHDEPGDAHPQHDAAAAQR